MCVDGFAYDDIIGNITDEAFKEKRFNVELIILIVLLFLFCPVIIKLCASFFLDLVLYYL